ncbi:WEB family protein At1g12150-like [Nicotiana sylvestris]|uniref:WEB family protein At1g12150-like n=1 Tax=Nicotiana sylvestris TaxID=4096 RepID=UPI00388C3D86
MVFDEAHRILNQLNQCEADLKRLTEVRDALKCLYVQKEEELKDLRAELAKARKEEAELDDQLQKKLERIELLRGEVDQVKANYDRWKENLDRLAVEKEAALVKLMSAEVQLHGSKEKGSSQAKRIEELEAKLVEAKAERETLEEIHARGFDLSEEIAEAKVLETDAWSLFSSSDDENNQGGSNDGEGPEREADADGETIPGHN